MESEAIGIHSLPDEIIIMIMKCTSYSDCNSFMRTCKRYNDILKSSHSLWRVIYKKTAGKVMYNITAAHSEGNWISDVRQYLSLRESLIDLIVAMSIKHFRETRPDCGLENVKEIFAIALSSNTNYYCTVSIIQKHIHETNKKLNTYDTKSPYTLTEVYYGKMVLRYLMHVMLAFKFAQNESANLLPPEMLLNYFIQWIDPLNMHSDEEVQDLIKGMIYDVDRALLVTKDGVPLPEVKTSRTGVNGIYTEKEVLLAISHYMFKQRRMAQMTAFNEDTLDVVRTIKSNSGNAITLGAIFEAIARGFGITSCKLVAFTNHTYMEWRCNSGFRSETMKFSLDTGDLTSLGRCPFSGNAVRYSYFVLTFAEYIANSYVDLMGPYRNWHTENASHFLHFLSNSPMSEYYNFISYVRGLDHNKLAIPFNFEYIHEEHIHCIHALLALNKTPAPQHCSAEMHCYNTRNAADSWLVPARRRVAKSDKLTHIMGPATYNKLPKKVSVNHRVGDVKYCVGLICFNKVHDYVCVVRHWDLRMDPEFRARLDNPRQSDQPHYKVIAMDQTERYIAQENLMMVTNPSRIYHLEEVLGKEFSHFNGFFYVPNREKQMLFPEDLSIGNAYGSHRKQMLEKVQRC